MKKSDLKQLIKEEIKEVLNSSKHYWPIPSKWFNKYYTMDFYEDGPKIFKNSTGEPLSFSDVVKHYENEEGPVSDLF